LLLQYLLQYPLLLLLLVLVGEDPKDLLLPHQMQLVGASACTACACCCKGCCQQCACCQVPQPLALSLLLLMVVVVMVVTHFALLPVYKAPGLQLEQQHHHCQQQRQQPEEETLPVGEHSAHLPAGLKDPVLELVNAVPWTIAHLLHRQVARFWCE
jgi:hypothetical protein